MLRNYDAKRNYIAGGFEKFTVTDITTGLTATQLEPISGPFSGQGCEKIVFSVETGNIRVTLDGTTPTSSLGALYIADTETIYTLEGHANLRQFQAIRVTGTNGLMQIQFFFRG